MAINDDKKNIVKSAYLYFQEGQWDKAIQEYKKLLELDPEDINTHNMLGDVFVRKGAPGQAYDSYLKVFNEFTARGQMDKVALVRKKIASLDPKALPPEGQRYQNLFKQNLVAEAAMEQGETEQAITAFNEVLKLDPENLDVHGKLADLYEKAGRNTEASERYYFVAAAYLKNHLFKKAQEVLKKVVELDPKNLEARIQLAQIYMKQGSENDAKKEFLNIADQALLEDDQEKAATYATKAVELKSIEAHYILGVIFYRQKKWDQAKNELESLLRFKVGHLGALVNLGLVLNEMGQPDKGTDLFQKALKIDKDYIPALEAILESSIKKGNKNDTLSTLGSLVDRTLSKNDLDKALVHARQMVSLDPALPVSQAKLGEVLEKSGDFGGAADAYFKAALAHETNKKTQSYEEFLRKSLEANVDHPEAREKAAPELVAQIEAKWPADRPRMGRVAAAAEPVPEALPEPQAPEVAAEPVVRASAEEEFSAQIGIADHYAQQGMLDEAIEIYQQLIENFPDNAELKGKLNRVYTAYAKTGTDLTAALSAPPAPKVEKKVDAELDKMSVDMARRAQESTQKLVREVETKAKEEDDKKLRMELERKAREEAHVQAEEQLRRLVAEKEAKKAESQKTAQKELEEKAEAERIAKRAAEAEVERAAIRATEARLEKAIAEADALQKAGDYEKASEVFKRISDEDPKNLEAKRRLEDIQILMKAHADKKTSAAKSAEHVEPAGKDSDGKKRSSRIGYV